MKKIINSKEKFVDISLLILMSMQTIIMGVLFIAQVLRIYNNNIIDGSNKPYTREICLTYLEQILPIIIFWIILVIITFIYFSLKNKHQIGKKAKISNVTKMHNLEKIVIIENFNDQVVKDLREEKLKRSIMKVIIIIEIGFCSLMGLLYLANPQNFDTSIENFDLTKQAIEMTVHLIPWVIISFCLLIGSVIHEEISAKKSIVLLQALIKQNGKQQLIRKENKKIKIIKNTLQITILVIAIVFIITGIFNGGVNDVLQKAINICTECIGLG